MVFEAIVVDVLNRFIGDYVQNLDRSQLKLGIWGGDVVLENLELKDSAFAAVDLPVAIVKGRIGKLVLKIPWKDLYNSPVIVNIEEINLLVVPKSSYQYDADKEKKSKREAKIKQLLKIEEAKQKESETTAVDPNKASLAEKIVAQVTKNLQVRVTNIHIRYEDAFTNFSQPFAIGLTLYNLNFETTDEDWKIGNSQPQTKFIFKIITLDSFSLYLDGDNVRLFSSLDTTEIYKELKDGISTSNHKPNLSFILNPINPLAKLRLNPKPEVDGSDFTVPKVYILVDLQEITLSLSKSQFQNMMKLLESLDRMNRAALWRQYRPNVPLKGNAAIWWKFAFTCVVEEGVRRRKKNWSWLNMRQHREDFRTYKDLYRQKLCKKLTEESKKKIEALEDELDVLNITLARKFAEVEYARIESTVKEKESYMGKISSWFSWSSDKKKEEEESIARRVQEAMSGAEKSKLYAAIDYQENALPVVYPKTFIENEFNVLLNNLSICIVDDTLNQPEVLKFSLDLVQTKFQMRPSAAAIKVTSLIKSFTVLGHASHEEAIRPILVKSVTDGGNTNLLDFLFETNPEDESCDQRIQLFAQPLQIVYHAMTVESLSGVFKSPEPVELTGLQEGARSTMQQFKESSATGLQHAVSMQKVLDLKVDVKSSYVIVPENGVFNDTCKVIVAHFGSLKMQSVPRRVELSKLQTLSRLGSTEEEKITEMLEQSYDQFIFELLGVQILVANPDDSWTEARDVDTCLHILKPTNLFFRLSKCIIQDDPRLPSLKIFGRLPTFCLHMSDKKILQLAAIAFSLPKPSESDNEGFEKTKAVTYDIKSSTILAAEAAVKLSSTAEATRDTFTQLTKLELNFEIGEVKLLLSEAEELLLMLRISEMGLNIRQKDFELDVQAFISDICVEAAQFKSDGGEPLKIVSVQRDADGRMLSFSYLNVNRKSPAFTSAYHNIEQLIQLKFAKLYVVLHQEALLKVIGFSNDIQNKLGKLKPQSEIDKLDLLKRSTSTIASMYEYAKDAVGPRRAHRPVKKVKDEVVELQAEICLDSFSVVVRNELKPITNISVDDFQLHLKKKKSSNQIQAKLGSVSIIDPRPEALYKQILSFVEGYAANVEVITYNNTSRKNDNSAVDMSLNATVGSITFIFLSRYINELMCFVDCFQTAKEKVAEAGAAAARAASENVKDAYQKATKIKLEFHLQTPVVIIPKHSNCLSGIAANLGSVTISNKLHKMTEIQNCPILDRISVALDNLKLLRVVMEPNGVGIQREYPLLHPVSFHLNIVRNLCISWYKEMPEMEINGKLGAIQFIMSDLDYSTMMKVLEENFAEGKLVEVPEIESDNTIGGTIGKDRIGDAVIEGEAGEPFKRMTFNFNMESFMIMLRNSSSTHEVNEDVKTDPLMKRLDRDTKNQEMLSISCDRKASGDMDVDLSVNSFSLVFCVEYLVLLGSFFQQPLEPAVQSSKTSHKSKTVAKKEKNEFSDASLPTTRLRLKLSKPDIIVVEDPDDIDTAALVFENEVDIRLVSSGSNANIMIAVSKLQLFTSCYNPIKRADHLVEVLSPCDIDVHHIRSSYFRPYPHRWDLQFLREMPRIKL
ncbi:vacuolar protein sorting 13 [Chamberlinius hualienensis]